MWKTEVRFKGGYAGKRTPLFILGLVTGLLTTVTLGVYRFWAKTRIRKYIWSSVTFEGDSFEYTGTGLEKFLGFLTAVVILAVYLATIQLALFFFGVSLFANPERPDEFDALPIQFGPAVITFIAVLPLIFFAQYRAMRYRLARTRWRGLRFGMDHGAWRYALRALGHWILTVLTLGILLPRKTFWLEKFAVDRSWYGDARFEQQGRWTELYFAMKHPLIGICILIFGVFGAVAVESLPLAVTLAVVGTIWLLIGLVSYRVKAFIYLTRHKVLDGQIRFASNPRTSTIIARIVFGGFIVSVLAGFIFAIAGLVTASVLAQITSGEGASATAITVVLVALQYIAALALVDALVLVWITQPIISHLVKSISILNAAALDNIHQRASDVGADAEGFADALDVGGTF